MRCVRLRRTLFDAVREEGGEREDVEGQVAKQSPAEVRHPTHPRTLHHSDHFERLLVVYHSVAYCKFRILFPEPGTRASSTVLRLFVLTVCSSPSSPSHRTDITLGCDYQRS